MATSPRSELKRYAAAAGAVALAFASTYLTWPALKPTPWAFFFAAVMASAWYGGQGPSAVATALSTAVGNYFFLEPPHSFAPHRDRVIASLVFVSVSLFIGLLASVRRLAEAAERRQRLWFEGTLASIGDAVIATDTLGRITFMNPAAERLTRWKLSEALGERLEAAFVIVNEDTGEAVENPAARVLREGCVVGLANHTVLVGRDGARIPIDDSGAPIRDGDGRILGVVLVFRDVTERKESDRMLRASAAIKGAILESALDCVISIDQDGRIVEWNPAAERTFGFGRGEAVGQAIAELIIPPGSRESHYRGMARYRATGEGPVLGRRVEVSAMRRDGSEFPAELAITPIELGETRLFTAYVRDITERKQAEEELRTTARRKDEFLAMLAHELRNPLAAIGTAIHLTRCDAAGEHLGWCQEVIERQVKHLARLIDDLLDVSRLTTGKIRLQRAVIDAASVVRSAVDSVRPLFEARHHALSVTLTPDALWCEADPLRLEQVLTNLLTNAGKYTEPGGRISLDARHDGDHLTFTVLDTGVGIPPEQLPRMFELFAQGDRSLARSEGGLGIGLTLVKRIAEMHGGSVRATSDGPGKGSRFTVNLPATAAPPPAAPPAGEDRARGSRSRVLVVDDNVDMAVSISRLLRLGGHEVWMAHDGLEAIPAARAHRPEFVVLDIGMPGMDGYEVARRLRGEESCKDAVLIAVTGYGQEEDRRRSREAGFDHHLVKPLDGDTLLSLLSRPQ